MKGLAPLACKTDRIDAWVLADALPARPGAGDLAARPARARRARARPLSPAPGPAPLQPEAPRSTRSCSPSASPARSPISSASRGRELLARLELPEPWQGNDRGQPASDRRARARRSPSCERELRRLGADHPYVPLLLTVPGIGWVLAFTIAAEIGDISRFPTPRKLTGYTRPLPARATSRASATCAARSPSRARATCAGRSSRRHARLHHPAYRERYQHTKRRIGKQRGAKVAQIDLARRLTEAIWHMLTRERTLRSQRRHRPPGRLTALLELRHRSELQSALSSPSRRR